MLGNAVDNRYTETFLEGEKGKMLVLEDIIWKSFPEAARFVVLCGQQEGYRSPHPV